MMALFHGRPCIFQGDIDQVVMEDLESERRKKCKNIRTKINNFESADGLIEVFTF